MFDNSTVALMAMIILAFTGMIVMFLFIIKALSEHTLAVKEYQREQHDMLLDVERLIREISFSIRHEKVLSRPRQGAGQSAGQDVSEMLGGLEGKALQRLAQKFPGQSKPVEGSLKLGESSGKDTQPEAPQRLDF